MAAEEHERRRRVVLVIDEAHMLSPDQLEAIRLFTNADMDSATACSVLLVGQPTLARQLRMGIFAALDQRIATRYHITPMDLGESADYLRHHLALVGRTDPLFALCRSRHNANYPESWIMPSSPWLFGKGASGLRLANLKESA